MTHGVFGRLYKKAVLRQRNRVYLWLVHAVTTCLRLQFVIIISQRSIAARSVMHRH